MNIDELKQEIKKLKTQLAQTEDFIEQIKIKRDIAKLRKDLYDLILEDQREKKRYTAYELKYKKKQFQVIEYWQTGLPFIDKMDGIPKGAFIQFGASSEAGKTTWCIALALSIARLGEYVCHFNFEMAEPLLLKKIEQFRPTEEQLKRYYIDGESFHLEDLEREITILAKSGVNFFVIDSRMKIRVSGNLSRSEKASLISDRLQSIARLNNVTIILINQLSEESQKTGMPNLKESGDQIYDADMVWFLLKPIKNEAKKGGMIEFDNSFRRFVVFKNRFDFTEDQSKHYSIDVRKDELFPKYVETKIVEPQIEIPSTLL